MHLCMRMRSRSARSDLKASGARAQNGVTVAVAQWRTCGAERLPIKYCVHVHVHVLCELILRSRACICAYACCMRTRTCVR